MRYFLIFEVIFISGCMFDNKNSKYEESWVKPVKQKISKIELNYNKSKEGLNLFSCEPNYYEYYFNVYFSILDLWGLTGNCLYGDIPCDKLANNAPIIIERYKRFIGKNKTRKIEDLFLEGIQEDINLLNTKYCWMALYYLDSKIILENQIMPAGYPECIDVPKEIREEAQLSMRNWYEKNKNNLEWNSNLNKYQKKGFEYLGFELPIEARLIPSNYLELPGTEEILRNEPNLPIHIETRNPKVRSAHFVSAPYTIKINESFNSEQFQNIKFKLLKIDKEKNRCLIKYEGSADNKIINPEWFEKGKAIFPDFFGERRVIVDDIRDEEISIVISVGGVITEEYD